MVKIRVVLFDIGNVLMLADLRRTIEAFILYLNISRNQAEQYFKRPDYGVTAKGKLEWAEYCNRLRREWGVSTPNEEILDIHGSHIYAIDQGLMSIIDALMNQVIVAFVTNTNLPEWQRYISLQPRFKNEFNTWRSDIVI